MLLPQNLFSRAMVALDGKERDAFWRSIESMGTPRSRLSSIGKRRKATWIREGLVARVRHLRGEEMLRHATLQSLDVAKTSADELGKA